MLQQQFVPIEIFFFSIRPVVVRAFLYYHPSDFFLIPVLFRGETADAPDEGRPSDRKLHLFSPCCFFLFFVSFFTSLYGKFQHGKKKENKALYFRGRRNQIQVLGFIFSSPNRIFSPFSGMKLILSVDY
jgi:hypothetical protein